MFLCNACLQAEGLNPDRPRPTQETNCGRCGASAKCQQVDVPVYTPPATNPDEPPKLAEFLNTDLGEPYPVEVTITQFDPPIKLKNGETASVTFTQTDGKIENVRVRVIRSREDLELLFKELEAIGEPGFIHTEEMVRAAYAAYPDGSVTYTPEQEKRIADQSYNDLCMGKGGSEHFTDSQLKQIFDQAKANMIQES